jgi:hypothetical protein
MPRLQKDLCLHKRVPTSWDKVEDDPEEFEWDDDPVEMTAEVCNEFSADDRPNWHLVTVALLSTDREG